MKTRFALPILLLGACTAWTPTAFAAAWQCNPKCPTCLAAQAAVQTREAIINESSKPIIGPAYTCHDPDWASQDPNVGRWQSIIDSVSQQTDNGYMPPLFTAAEMHMESGGNPDAIGAPVPNRALGLMQTLPPSEEQDAQSFGDVRGYNGTAPTAWPRLPNHQTPLPTPQHSIRMGLQDQVACAKLFVGALDPAALAACYNQGPGWGEQVAKAHNDYQLVFAGKPAAAQYVSGFLAAANCTPVAPTASTHYRIYP